MDDRNPLPAEYDLPIVCEEGRPDQAGSTKVAGGSPQTRSTEFGDLYLNPPIDPTPPEKPVETAFNPVDRPRLLKLTKTQLAQQEEGRNRVKRFADEFIRNGGNASAAAKVAGTTAKNENSCRAVGAILYKKAKSMGLLKDSFQLDGKNLDKDAVMALLTDQAMGKKPSRKTETYRRDKSGRLIVAEVKNEYDELGAQEKIAKILGLYEETVKTPAVNIAVVLGKLEGRERAIAEAEIIEAHTKMLEAENGE